MESTVNVATNPLPYWPSDPVVTEIFAPIPSWTAQLYLIVSVCADGFIIRSTNAPEEPVDPLYTTT